MWSTQVIDYVGDKCVLRLRPISDDDDYFQDYARPREGTSSVASSDSLVILGAPFLHRYCVYYDVDRLKVYIAEQHLDVDAMDLCHYTADAPHRCPSLAIGSTPTGTSRSTLKPSTSTDAGIARTSGPTIVPGWSKFSGSDLQTKSEGILDSKSLILSIVLPILSALIVAAAVIMYCVWRWRTGRKNK